MKKVDSFTQRKVVPLKIIVLLSVVLIMLAGSFVYLDSLDGRFIWDDNHLVKNNTYIRDLSCLPNIFTESLAGGSGDLYLAYRPLQILTYMFDYSLWGLNHFGFHLTNILLHILTALAVYWFVTILFDDRLLSLITGLLFAVHPIHTEAVCYISGRADPLSALFILLSFIFYAKLEKKKNFFSEILIFVFYILALLSRESSLILPLLIILYSYIFGRKINKRVLIVMLGTTAAYVFLRMTVLKFSVPLASNYASTTLLQRVPGFFAALGSYVSLLFLPLNLHMEYGIKLFYPAQLQVILGFIIFLLLVVYAFSKRGSNKLISFALFWFLAALLPVSNFYPINSYMAEHWLYLPSVGFFLISGWILTRLYRKRRCGVLMAVVITGLLFFYGCLTVKQCDYWKDALTFYKRTLRCAPSSHRLYSTLGNEYSQRGRYKEAIASCKRAIELKPDYSFAYYNLGNAYNSLGRYEKAIVSFRKSIELNKTYVNSYNNLAIAYSLTGELKKAVAASKEAIKLKPDYALAHYNLALFYMRQGKSGLARQSADRLVELGYDLPEKFIEMISNPPEDK
ncbi:MAG: tetratricopeptide repeat protein [Candidatus Omnitrophica bacterium]|nr:tetratricopeptide repeat protein [Candidatus Omnitrophota bacterium]